MKRRNLALGFVLALGPLGAITQTLDAPGAIRAAILAKYHTTQATADFTDIVTPGDVITLLKSGLVMYDVTKPISRSGVVSYHDGKLYAGGLTKMMLIDSGPNSDIPVRQFVSGEKCWMVGVTIKSDGLYLTFLSDPIQDVRYMGSIKFPYDRRDPVPSPEAVLALMAEVISAAPLPQQAPEPTAAAEQAVAPPVSEIQPPPIAPPPPPSDQPAPPPPTISLGQARTEVLASFGQPLKIIKLGTKEIDSYKDMRVTYVNDKVTDVQ